MPFVRLVRVRLQAASTLARNLTDGGVRCATALAPVQPKPSSLSSAATMQAALRSRTLLVSVVVLLCVLSQLAWLADEPAPPMWPMAAIAFAAGWCWGRRWVLISAIAAVCLELAAAHGVQQALVVGLATLVGPLVAIGWLRHSQAANTDAGGVQATLHALWAMVAVAAPLDATVAALGRPPTPGSAGWQLAEVWIRWWLADALGFVLCVPTLLVAAGKAPFDPTARVQAQRWQPDATGLILIGAVAFLSVLATQHGAAGQLPIIATALVVVVAVAALRTSAAATVVTSNLGAMLVIGAFVVSGEAAAASPTAQLQLSATLLAAALVAHLIQALAAERSAALARLEQQSSEDTATGLLNETGLRAGLRACLDTPQRAACGLVAVKLVNMAAVESQCDARRVRELDRSVAALLTSRSGTVLAARLSAGRYAALVAADSVMQLRSIARAFYSELNGRVFETEHGSLELQACIGGLLVAPQAPVDADDCLSALTDALTIAASVRDPQLFVEPLSQTMIDARRAHRDKLEQVADAIHHGRLELFAQPLDDLERNAHRIEYEVFTRLRDRDGTLIPPMEFIPLAQQAQLMGTLDRAVIGRVFAWLANHPHALVRTGRCSINLSGASMVDPTIAAFVRQQRMTYNIPAAKIVFEIAESEAIRNPAAAARLLEDLKADGHGIALDNFGAGLATFEYLRRFPLDYLKIDGSFIRNIGTSPIDEELVTSTIRVARRLNVRTVAEHVHSQPVLDRLQQLGVDHVQGELIGAPRPLAELFSRMPASAGVVGEAAG